VRKQQRGRASQCRCPRWRWSGYTTPARAHSSDQLTGAQVLQSPKMFRDADQNFEAIELPSRARFCCRTRSASSATCRTRLVTASAPHGQVAQAEVLLHVRDAPSLTAEKQKTQVRRCWTNWNR